MSQPPAVSIVHIGICTSDVQRSIAFYTQALGFTLTRSIDGLGAPFDTLLELPGSTFSAHHLSCGAVTIELVGYGDTGVVGSKERRPMNQLGFTHMTLMVDDVGATIERIRQYGGQLHPETKIDSAVGPLCFCTDPDGVRIELMKKPA